MFVPMFRIFAEAMAVQIIAWDSEKTMHEFDRADERKAMIKDIQRLAGKIGKTPTIKELKRDRRSTQFSYDQILRVFGNWTSAVKAAGLTPNPIGEPPSNKYNRKKLIDEFVRAANELRSIPSHPHFSANSTMSRSPFERTFGSWRKAVATIIGEARDRFTFPIDVKKGSRKGKSPSKPKVLGLEIPLLFAPRNETETLILFTLLAPELGYEIESAQIGFPDLTLRKASEIIRAEVEFLSSTYLAHGHPLEADILCVCWRKDKDIPGLRKVLALEAVLRSMANNAFHRTPARGTTKDESQLDKRAAAEPIKQKL